MLTAFKILAIVIVAMAGKAIGGELGSQNAGLIVGIGLGYFLAVITYDK